MSCAFRRNYLLGKRVGEITVVPVSTIASPMFSLAYVSVGGIVDVKANGLV